MNSSFSNRWSFSYLKFTKYVTNIIAEPKYKYGQQEQVTIRNFRHSRTSNSKVSNLIRLEIKLVQAFMSILVTSNFDDYSIKNERDSIFPFFFRRSVATNSVASGQIWPKLELVRDFMHVSLPASIKRIGSKTTEKRWRHRFPHYKSMGAFCCHGNQF